MFQEEPRRMASLGFDDGLEVGILHSHNLHSQYVLDETRDLFSRLERIALFSDMAERSLRALLKNAQKQSPPPGTELVERGTSGEALYLILQGYVGSYADDGADAECLIDLLGADSFIGLPEILLARPYEHVYRTFGETHILRIPTQDLMNALETDWNLLKSMMGGLSQRLHRLVKQIDGLKTQKAEQRLVTHFLELIEQNAGACAFTLPYDKKDLAAHLGIVPASLSRALKRLKARGIHVKGRVITVDDPRSLMDFVENSGLPT